MLVEVRVAVPSDKQLASLQGAEYTAFRFEFGSTRTKYARIPLGL
jgi:hypothetical protein